MTDEELRRQIKREGKIEQCDFCRHNAKSISNDVFIDKLLRILNDWFHPKDEEFDDEEGEPLSDIVKLLCGCSEECALKIIDELNSQNRIEENSIFEEDVIFNASSILIKSYSKPYYDDDPANSWGHLMISLRHFNRHFPTGGRSFLDNIFEGVQDIRDSDNNKVLSRLRKGSKLIRARWFQDIEAIKHAIKRPGSELGGPPSYLSKSGRMNAEGITCFYGAFEKETAIAEVRPPVGSYVTSIKFKTLREMKVLDFDALAKMRPSGSYFDSKYIAKLERVSFFAWLTKELTKTVLPGKENLEYLSTQFLADYLSARRDLKIDGISYPSVQNAGGKNVFLFARSSNSVPKSEIEKDDSFDMFGYDNNSDLQLADYYSREKSYRLQYLEPLIDTLEVDKVREIKFTTSKIQPYLFQDEGIFNFDES